MIPTRLRGYLAEQCVSWRKIIITVVFQEQGRQLDFPPAATNPWGSDLVGVGATPILSRLAFPGPARRFHLATGDKVFRAREAHEDRGCLI